MNEAWSDIENDHIVSDYLSMLSAELSGISYNKSEHRRALAQKLNGRSDGSIEFKHQNISAVMLGLNQPWIQGYKPARQFQLSLIDAVLRHAEIFDDWSGFNSRTRQGLSAQSLRDPGALFVGPPPTFSNEKPEIDPEFGLAIARKYNAAERDERNRKLGEEGEEFAIDYEKYRLRTHGRSDLVNKIVWTSREEGDGAGYDISSFNEDGTKRLIEVKTTNGFLRSPFYISRNELSVADANRDSWTLFRLYDFAREPKAFEIYPPIERHVELTATSFLAKLN